MLWNVYDRLNDAMLPGIAEDARMSDALGMNHCLLVRPEFYKALKW